MILKHFVEMVAYIKPYKTYSSLVKKEITYIYLCIGHKYKQ